LLAKKDDFGAEIFDFISTDPGVTQIEIEAQMPIAWNAVNYHVHRLLESQQIKGFRVEPALHLFTPEIPDEVLSAIAALRRANADSIIRSLESPKQLCEIQSEVNLGKNVVRAQIARLKEAAVIESEGFRRPIYRVNESKLDLARKFSRGEA
jgi:predicted transcriptional regulator